MILDLISSETTQIATLAVIGLLVGAFCNYAIYEWRWFWNSILPVSPWQFFRRSRYQESANENQKLTPASPLDFIPVIGWFLKSRDSKIFGAGFWMRPLLIEVAFAVGLPLFFIWQRDGGLLGFSGQHSATTEAWFWGHTILIVLMTIATFIDFDEKTIPDKVTISGTLIALVIATLLPGFRLPEQLGPGIWQSITFCSPDEIPGGYWHHDFYGLLVAAGILTVWCFALLPFTWKLDGSVYDKIRFALGSVIRPPRKTKCKVGRDVTRGPRLVTWFLCGLWIALMIYIAIAWYLLSKDVYWNSLFGAVVGLGVGGGLVWSVRIVAGWAMQREAMGFGDVTLMAMIGAFLGWQAAVLTFFLAPVGGMLITLVQFIATRRSELAFGPYLCGTAFLLLFFWSSLWPPAATGFFFVGGKWLAITLVAVLVAMALMLA
ncbi:MAG: A24 family peptidase, partial [Planctomycetota bacterium]